MSEERSPFVDAVLGVAKNPVAHSGRAQGDPSVARCPVYVLTWQSGDTHGSGIRVYANKNTAEDARTLLSEVGIHCELTALEARG